MIVAPAWVSEAMQNTHVRSLDGLHPFMRGAFAWMACQLPENAWLYCYQGYRGRAAQEAAFEGGRSRARFGESWHSIRPALALDCVPVWIDRQRQVEWGSERTKTLLSEIAEASRHLVHWGGNWTNVDRYHFQLFPESKPKEFMMNGYDIIAVKKEES